MKIFSTLSAFAVLLSAGTAAAWWEEPVQVPAFQAPVAVTRPSAYHPLAPQAKSDRTPIQQIVWNGHVRCGSDLSVKTYAHQEDGVWEGIDADLCRVIAQALIGDNKRIKMVNVAQKDMEKALDTKKIDVMLSGGSYSAKTETSRQALNAGLLYYDHQMLMVHANDSDDLETYRGKKICLSTDSDYYKNFDEYNARYNLGMKYLTFNSLKEAKEAFLLNRCQMMTASGLMLNGILKDLPGANAKVLEQRIALHPVYAYVQRNDDELRLALKWIFNAMFLAEQYNISIQNLEFYKASDNPEVRNLLGDNEDLWKDLKVQPRWLREIIGILGNYKDIFDKNLGIDSEYKLERGQGRLVKDGGTIYPQPFI